MTASSPIVLQACGISWKAKGNAIVHDISLDVRAGETLGLVGPNGSGKSTLLRLLSGVIHPHEGEVLLGENSLRKTARRKTAQQLAFVAQMAETLDAINVWDAVELGRTPWLSALQPLSEEDRRIVRDALNAVGLLDKERSAWNTLSGGERQRVHIARALAQQPRVLLLDEPTNHLDIHQQLSLMQLVHELPIAKVVALHDLNQALTCDRLAVMSRGQLVCVGLPQEVLVPQLLQEIFKVRVRELIDPQDGSRVLRFQPLDSQPYNSKLHS
ncbi:ABC transporter ATP-binding protein (plasmid) [Diaphorobacter sp. HDW4B]|uniref:ABC transporter ATP-binding protein n=1 Tax=Diaphorobacter sp. HDW4B TaxID=2714925 RepID=UPI00140CBBC0|nr:ABC transporter ATP-binding protein [Diaphorobacter sp. HDW4B]QIL73780.1 ABC transporter ATP-binding protein [Diaphorobacter sp. HDW4B]